MNYIQFQKLYILILSNTWGRIKNIAKHISSYRYALDDEYWDTIFWQMNQWVLLIRFMMKSCRYQDSCFNISFPSYFHLLIFFPHFPCLRFSLITSFFYGLFSASCFYVWHPLDTNTMEIIQIAPNLIQYPNLEPPESRWPWFGTRTFALVM